MELGKSKWVLDNVRDEAGGSFGVSSVSELIHDCRQQVYSAFQHGCGSGLGLQAPRRTDPSFDLNKGM